MAADHQTSTKPAARDAYDTLAIDLGTTNLKVARFTADHQPVAIVSRTYHKPGEHEVPFDRFWNALKECIAEVMASTFGRPDVVGIGISSQTNSFLLLGDQGQVLTPIVLWTADFASQEAADLQQRMGDQEISEATGMKQLTGQLLAPKCLSLYRKNVAPWRKAKSLRLLPDYIVQRLTGRAVTDASLWSLTGFYDLRSMNWWQSMLGCLEQTSTILPVMASAGWPAGQLAPRVAQALNLPPAAIVATPALDHLCAALGSNNTEPGRASLSLGTVSCTVVTHDQRPETFVEGVIGPHPAEADLWYALAWSGLSSTGLQWYADQLGEKKTVADLQRLLSEGVRSAGGWRAIPREAGNASAGFDFKNDDPEIKGSPRPALAARAICETLSSETQRIIAHAAGQRPIESVTVSGGGSRSDFWLQLLADTLKVPVYRPSCIETALRGAALLAGHAAGKVESLQSKHATMPMSKFAPRSRKGA